MRFKALLIVATLIAGVCLCPRQTKAQSATTSTASLTTASAATPASGGNNSLPTTGDILRKFTTAIGEGGAAPQFTTRIMKGIYQTEDLSGFAGIEVTNKAPNKSFTKITFSNGIVVLEVCDGTSAWLEDPSGRMHEFTGAALESRLRLARFNQREETVFAMAKGQVVGTAQVGTHSTYVLAVSLSKELHSKVYFDTATGLAVRADDTIRKDDADYKVENYMDDYRPVDGVYYPFKIRHAEKGNVYTVRVTQIKNNPPVDDSIFVKPRAAAAKQ
jgi:hypothetical protein